MKCLRHERELEERRLDSVCMCERGSGARSYVTAPSQGTLSFFSSFSIYTCGHSLTLSMPKMTLLTHVMEDTVCHNPQHLDSVGICLQFHRILRSLSMDGDIYRAR